MMTMSRCAQIMRGAAARLRGGAANDNAATRSLMMQSALGVPAAGVIAAFAIDRELFRLERSRARPRLHTSLHASHDSDYDDLLARVGAEMALPSA
jgi:hypothetical protein